MECIRNILRQRGVLGLYRGAFVMVPRDAPTYGIYMISYEWMLNQLRKHVMTGFGYTAIAGGIAGTLCWFCAMPFDVVKNKMQAAVLKQERASIWYVLNCAVCNNPTIIEFQRSGKFKYAINCILHFGCKIRYITRNELVACIQSSIKICQ